MAYHKVDRKTGGNLPKSNSAHTSSMGNGVSWRQDNAPESGDALKLDMKKAREGETNMGGPTNIEHSISGGKVRRRDSEASGEV